MENEYILEMKNITKVFPGVKALDNVNLKVRKGTVHALMGENGAGKSTLMKILIGMHKPTSGEVIFKGKRFEEFTINNSLNLGISMIHQELTPLKNMTVAENIFLNREPMKKNGIVVDRKKQEKDTKKLLEELGIDIAPNAKVGTLSIANIQLIEIAKAISYNADLIIMDEPTSAITDSEVENLFKIIEMLKDREIAMIYITHKMDEVFKIADEITIMRDGEYIETENADDIDENKLIEMMVGRELTEMFPKEIVPIGDVKLSVRNLTFEGKFNNVSFDVRKGEIVGIAGLMGAGRTEVAESIFGINKLDSGEIYIDGKKVDIESPKSAIKYKIGLLTEDRVATGLFLPSSVKDNMIIVNIDDYLKNGSLDKSKIEKNCNEQKDKLSIKTPTIDTTVGSLSGGNQQKVLLARWLLTDPDILILDEPTRGIDVGAKAEIHKLMCQLARQGKAIIMISSELPEILGMSDRIVVMHDGRKTGELNRNEATQEKIMKYATGVA